MFGGLSHMISVLGSLPHVCMRQLLYYAGSTGAEFLPLWVGLPTLPLLCKREEEIVCLAHMCLLDK